MNTKANSVTMKRTNLGLVTWRKCNAGIVLLMSSFACTAVWADTPEPIPASAPTMSQVVERVKVRQAAFKEVEDTLEQVDDGLDGDETDWVAIKHYSDNLVLQGQILVAAFPLYSVEPETDDTRAKTKIWQNPDKFKKLMAELTLSFAQLQQASIEKNITLAEQGFEQADGTCRSCHMSYRSLW